MLRNTARRAMFYGGVLTTLVLAGAYMKCMPGESVRADAAVAAPQSKALARQLRADVEGLAKGIGERRLGLRDTLFRARDYLARKLYTVVGQSHGQVRFERLSAAAESSENVIFELPSSNPEVVIVGAHYDSAIGTPGANDNASGVAVALALARRLAPHEFRRKLRFVLFANEEPPYFQTEQMGSLVHARGCRQRGESVVAMLSLESLGYFSDEEGSQRYPWPVGWFYPDHGDFIGFVANLQSRQLVREAIESFRETRLLPSEGAALPAAVPGVGWSDHWAFWQQDYPAIMVTDTAVFRDPNYHQPSDHPDHLDYTRMARVTLGLERVIDRLAIRI